MATHESVNFNIHYLKTWPEYFAALGPKRKTFELRKDDRDYRVGDLLILIEFDPTILSYSGKIIAARISYILRAADFPAGISKGYAVLALEFI